MSIKFVRFLCFLPALIVLLSFHGCVDRLTGEDSVYSTGEILTPEMIESIFNEISTPVTEKYPTETDELGSMLLYWLEGGSVWHASLSCGSVAKASPEKLHQGNITDAIAAGKERGCKVCAKNLVFDTVVSTELDETSEKVLHDKYPKDYDSDGNLIVYWVKGGSVWHVSKKCSSLSKSSDTDILSGTESDAITSGKERACKKCSNDN